MAEQDEPTDGRPTPGRPSLFSTTVRWRSVIVGLAVLACVPTWLSLGARWWWVFDLATSFVWWYAVGIAAALVAVLGIRQWRLVAFVAITLVVNLVQLAPYAPLPQDVAPAGEPRLRVMTLNVLTSNRSYEAVLDLIRRESPDIVALLEVNQRWSDALASLAETHPHRTITTRQDNFGVALYSRLPTDQLEVRELSPDGTPTGIAKLVWNNRPLTIIAAHPLPPMGPRNAASRNADLTAYAQLAAEQSGEVILMGDLNLPPFSPYFHDLLHAGNLRDSSASRGLHATWGTSRLGLVIPIDHVLPTTGLSVVDRRVGPDVGSDHRAVIVDFIAVENTNKP